MSKEKKKLSAMTIGDLAKRSKAKVDQSAGDHNPEALKAAHHNFLLTKPDWCACKGKERSAYYRDRRSGLHGWMCVECHRITQTG